ncbi:conserved Plasmodium protein, unknown function [Plasmodium vinckei vinckei]|uniref:Uncharacterized protein n=1 Tax=Plasmodium vinckei vinckei TaxID=54757 RepID=A0A449BWZ7_PLAVN|nr:conserved Plasmodium protein, unknown function [Plasmodium vinckei vinckei]KEG03575.1 hypothetical protein YYE_01599 [Plasmodium vinckei vinckei]VEV57869.1 conserved Plasmodium protein, unknown function [Plasmodium vinckei vinckei]
MIKHNINYYERKEVIKRNVDEARLKLFNSIPKLSLFHLDNIEYKNGEIKESKQTEGVKKKTKLLDKTKLKKIKNNEPYGANKKDYTIHQKSNNQINRKSKELIKNIYSNNKYLDLSKLRKTVLDNLNNDDKKNDQLFTLSLNVKNNKKNKLNNIDIKGKNNKSQPHVNKPNVGRTNKDGVKIVPVLNVKFNKIDKTDRLYSDNNNIGTKKNTKNSCTCNRDKSKMPNHLCSGKSNKESEHLASCDIKGKKKKKIIVKNMIVSEKKYLKKGNLKIMPKEVKSIKKETDKKFSLQKLTLCSKNKIPNINEKKKEKKIQNDTLCRSIKNKRNELVTQLRNKTMSIKYSMEEKGYKPISIISNITTKLKDDICDEGKIPNKKRIQKTSKFCLGWKKDNKNMGIFSYSSETEEIEEAHGTENEEINKEIKNSTIEKIDSITKDEFITNIDTELRDKKMNSTNFLWEKNCLQNSYEDKKYTNEEGNDLINSNNIMKKKRSKSLNSINDISPFNSILVTNDLRIKMCYSNNYIDIKKAIHDDIIKNKDKNIDQNKKIPISINNYNILNSSDDLFLISMDSEKTRSSYILQKKKNSHTTINNTTNLALDNNLNDEETFFNLGHENGFSNSLLYKRDLCKCDNNSICNYCTYKIQNKPVYNKQLFSSIKLTSANKIELWSDQMMDSIFYPENEKIKLDKKISTYPHFDHKSVLFEPNKNPSSHCNTLTESNIFIFDIVDENCSKFIENENTNNNISNGEVQDLKEKENTNLNEKNSTKDRKTKNKKMINNVTLKKCKDEHKEVLTNLNEQSKNKDKKKKLKIICTKKSNSHSVNTFKDDNKKHEMIVKSKNGWYANISDLSHDPSSRTKKKEKRRPKKQNHNNDSINKYENDLILCHLKREEKIRKSESNPSHMPKESAKNRSTSLTGKKKDMKNSVNKIKLKEKVLTNKFSEKCIDSLMAYRNNLIKNVEEEEDKNVAQNICEFHHSNINFKDDKENQINKMAILKLLISDKNKKSYIKIEKENKIIKRLNTNLCVNKSKRIKKNKTKNGQIKKRSYNSIKANIILKRKSKIKSLLKRKNKKIFNGKQINNIEKENGSNIKSITMVINENLDNFMSNIRYVSNYNNNGSPHTFESVESDGENKSRTSKTVKRTNLWEEMHMPICGENYIEVLPNDQKYLCLNCDKKEIEKEIKYSIYTKKYIKKKYNNKKKCSIKMKILYKRLYQTKDTTFFKIPQKMITKNNFIHNCEDGKEGEIQTGEKTKTRLDNKIYDDPNLVIDNFILPQDTQKDTSMSKKKKKKKKKLTLDYRNDKGENENITHDDKNKKINYNNIVTIIKNEPNFTKKKMPLNKFNRTSYSSENVANLVKPHKYAIQSAEVFNHKYKSDTHNKLIKIKKAQNVVEPIEIGVNNLTKNDKISSNELNNPIISDNDNDVNKIRSEKGVTKNKIELNFCFEDFLSSDLKQKLNHSNTSTNISSSNSVDLNKLECEFSLDLEKYVLNHRINEISLKNKLKNVESENSKYVEQSENINQTIHIKSNECEIVNTNLNSNKSEDVENKNLFKVVKVVDKDKLFCSNLFYRNHIINEKNEIKNKVFMKTINIKDKISNKIQEIKNKNTNLFRALSMNNIYKTVFPKDISFPIFENDYTIKKKQKKNSNSTTINTSKYNSYELIKTKSLIYKKNSNYFSNPEYPTTKINGKGTSENRLKIEDFLNTFDKKKNLRNCYIPTNGNKVFFRRSKSATLFKRNHSKSILQNYNKKIYHGQNCITRQIGTNIKEKEKTLKKCVSMVNEHFIKNKFPVNKSLINNSIIYKNNFLSTPCFMFESTLKKNTSSPVERH